MSILFFFLEIFSFKKKRLEKVDTVAILFLPPLGIGDLVMLSPAIQNIKNIFPHSKISLITGLPSIIKFEGIEFVNYKMLNKSNFDLVISPTLNLRHIIYILKSKFWIGYFAKPISQSNFSTEKCVYDLRDEHYLLKTSRLISLLAKCSGQKLEGDILEKNNLTYPCINQEKPALFDGQLGSSDYLVLGALSKWPDRQWPVEKFVEVISWALDSHLVDKIVIIGDGSKANIDLANQYVKLLNKFTDRIVNLTGVTTLAQTAYVLSKSKLYLGLDSGPSHLAYIVAPKSVAIFITVDPKLRLPFLANSVDRFAAVYLNPAPPQSLYNGLGPVSVPEVKKYIDRISVNQVIGVVKDLLLNKQSV